MNRVVNLFDDIPRNWLQWGKVNTPVFAYIAITNQCNSNCLYCQIENNDIETMTLSDFENYVFQCHEIGVMEIRIGGGEPLLHNNLNQMITIVKKYKMNAWLCTNGYLLQNFNKALELKKAGLFGIRLSLDSTNPCTNNRLRGNDNAWNYALATVQAVNSVGLQLVLSMTLTKTNSNEINNMKIFASNHGARLNVHPIMPMGKGKNFINIDCPEDSLNDLVKASIKQTSEEKICLAGNGMISIDCYGGVSPCTFIAPIASLHDLKLIDIIQSKEYRKYLSPLPTTQCDKCTLCVDGGCLIYPMCKGGCWALYEQENRANKSTLL